MTRELNPGLVGGDPPPFLSAVAANILLIGASFTFITLFTFIASESWVLMYLILLLWFLLFEGEKKHIKSDR